MPTFITNFPQFPWDVFTNVTGTALAAAIVAGWYWLRPFRSEQAWIMKSGLLFYVYYRNVDWRCEVIRRINLEILAGEAHGNPLQRFDQELNKLKSDIECLDRITELWADRVSGFPVWYPYRKDVNGLIEAATLLSLSLKRHADPMIWYIRDKKDSRGLAWSATKFTEVGEFGNYLSYFNGEVERMWIKAAKREFQTPEESAIIGIQQEGLLRARLEAVLKTLLSLLKRAGLTASRVKDAMPLWQDQGDPEQVWLRGASIDK
jgi:hypothetical protein